MTHKRSTVGRYLPYLVGGRRVTARYAIRLLRCAITRSGLSARKYAVEVLTRNERTIRRWLAGDSDIPRAVVLRLQREDAATHEAS